MARLQRLLGYVATHPDGRKIFRASDMLLRVLSDASFLSRPKVRVMVGVRIRVRVKVMIWVRVRVRIIARVRIRVRVGVRIKVRGENKAWPVSKRVASACTRALASKGICWEENKG